MLNLIYLINTLNTAIILKKSEIKITRFNSICLKILEILQKLNIIESFLINQNFTICQIFLTNRKYSTLVSKIICISKPNRYIYYNINELIFLRSLDSYNNYILSVNNKSHTILTIDDAIRLHVGGLLLLKIIKN